LALRNAPPASTNNNTLELSQNADGSSFLATGVNGTATRGSLTLDAPVITLPGGWISIVAPAATDAGLAIVKPASGRANHIYGYKAATLRWGIELGGAEAETGADAGSDFSISRFNDAGTWISNPFYINRKTGNVTAQGLTTTQETAELRERLEAALIRITQLEAAYGH
jgi:hypothetical protein